MPRCASPSRGQPMAVFFSQSRPSPTQPYANAPQSFSVEQKNRQVLKLVIAILENWRTFAHTFWKRLLTLFLSKYPVEICEFSWFIINSFNREQNLSSTHVHCTVYSHSLKKFNNIGDTFKRAICILVNWLISTVILTRINTCRNMSIY